MKKNIINVAILWFIIIFCFNIFNFLILINGEDIILKTRPIDPRDFFRGDYVALRYDIENFETEKDFKKAKKIYVILDEDENNIGYIKDLSLEKPKGALFIKGKISDYYRDREKDKISYTIEYDSLKKYYRNSKEAKELEKEYSAKSALINIKVNSLGDARIDKIIK